MKKVNGNALPIISLITPSLDQASYILQTIDSVLAQSYSNIEYFVIDGGSTDGTRNLLENYGKKFHQIKWLSEPDCGQATAINKGWRIANGEIFAWINADDIYLPGALNIVSEYLLQHPNVDIVYGDCDYIDEVGQTLGVYPTYPYDYENLVKFAINYIPQPGTFIRRRVLESIGFLDETLHYVMDYDYWLRAGLQHNIAYIPIKLAKMRIHSDAKSIKNLASFSEELITIYTKLFATVNLPSAVQKLEKEAMHHAFRRAAHISFWGQQPQVSYRYAQKALQLQPFSIQAWRLLFTANKLGVRFANLLMNYPYFLKVK